MTQHSTVENQKGFFKNDTKLVCSMLVVYGLCIIGLIIATFWGLNRRRLTLSANATSKVVAAATQTVAVAAMQQADGTATVIAHTTEQAQYAFVDPFTKNTEYWRTGSTNDEYANYSQFINGGVYMWQFQEVKQPFLDWAPYRMGNWMEDFDVYVDTKIKTADGEPIDACSGFTFRTVSLDWEEGTYTFSVCNDSYFVIDYFEQGEWDVISDWMYSDVIETDDWNRLEIRARGNLFTFTINNQVVFEMMDDRAPKGGLGLLVEVNEEKPVSIWFDNFGLQRR